MKTNHLFIKIIYYSFLTLILAVLFVSVYSLIIPILMGYIIAFLWSPMVSFFERIGLGKHQASIFILLLHGFLFYSVFHYSNDLVDTQWKSFQSDKSIYVKTIDTRVLQVKKYFGSFLDESVLHEYEEQIVQLLKKKWISIKENIPDIFHSGLIFASNLLTTLIFAFLFIEFGGDIKKFIISLIPNRYFEMSLVILYKTDALVGGYVRGLILDCLANGFLYAVFLSLLGVKGGLMIGIFAGIMNAIPYAGPIIGAIPALLSVLIDPNPSVSWWAIPILFGVVHMFDNIFIYPSTVGKELKLNPFVVIFGIFAGGALGGILGMLMAVPIIGITKEVFTVLHVSLKSYKII
ncbi:MAG: AI-2E family transporter [Leptospiraceae bacterium]|nr:AI-2E family transporter [Leptospiraceae bacterium]